MKWQNAGAVEELVWMLREAEQVRASDRVILNRLYGGEAPFDPAKAEENQVQINRNDLEGVNLLAQARRQWNQAMLGPGNVFSVTLDTGPRHKRREWSHAVTRHANRVLKRSRRYMEQGRATGANVMLHGIGASIWDSRRTVVSSPLMVGSVLIPSDTDLDFENLEYFAVFREWTPAQLFEMTHGTKVDPGWNMPMVQAQYKYVRDQVLKRPNATAYQYMPERIEELIKQDKTYAGSDAVPTIDVWDFYGRAEDCNGWVRRVILDWNVGAVTSEALPRPVPVREKEDERGFLYTSGNRKYATNLNEIFHCQFGDCSAVAPFKYHSVRSLGWMLWGVCDLQNRLYCKFNEAVFEQLMWFFRTASNSDLVRIKKANFYHMGVIPQGISFVPAQERYKPDAALIEMAFSRNRQIMAENAASFTQDFTKGETGKEMTATETMARVNSVNALVSGMLSLAYTYEEYKDREVMRRLCIKHNPDPMAQKFRKGCLEDGVPPEMLDVERMDITRERVMGGGNKTLEMAQVQFLQTVRKNLGPDAQRRVDHISIESATDDASLAEELAPVEGQQYISNSQHDAELSFERLMRGLPYEPQKDAVFEDFIVVWLRDAALIVQKIQQRDNMGTMDEVAGLANVLAHIQKFLGYMATDDEVKEKVRQYADLVKNLGNMLKGFAQRLQQATAKNGDGGTGADMDTAAKLKGKLMLDAAKAQNLRDSHAMRTAQKEAQFELEQQREDRRLASDLKREDIRAAQELAAQQMANQLEIAKQAETTRETPEDT